MTGHGERAAAQIHAMLARRATGATLCPSEVARALAQDPGDWRAIMAEVHAAADRLQCEGRIVLSWGGRRLNRRDGPYCIGAVP